MSMEADNDLSLEDELNAALDGEQRQEAPAQEEQAPETETAAEEQARYVREGRRFVKEQKEEQAAAKDGAQSAEKPAAKAWKPLWYKDEYGPWEQLGEPFRKALEQREKEVAQGIEKHSTAAKAWEPVNKLLEPHVAELRAAGVEPQQYVTNLIEADKFLRTDPVQGINWLCQQFLGAGWDIPALADWMAQQGVQANKVDPVKQELEALKRELSELKTLPQRQYQETVNKTISEWAKDKPDYPVLERTILGLIQADPGVRDQFRVNPQATLDALYERAQYAHPDIRERILKEKEDQRIEGLKRARAAGAQSPRGGYTNGSAAPSYKTMTLEEEIEANLS